MYCIQPGARDSWEPGEDKALWKSSSRPSEVVSDIADSAESAESEESSEVAGDSGNTKDDRVEETAIEVSNESTGVHRC